MTDLAAAPWTPPRWISPASRFEHQLAEWFAAAVKSAPKHWAATLSFQGELRLERIESLLAADPLQSIPENSVGVRFEIENRTGRPAFAVLERTVVLALLAGLFGQPLTALPEDREFTSVEQTLLEYLMQQFLTPFEAAWPGNETLKFQIAAVGTPKTVCVVPAEESFAKASVTLHGSFGAPASDVLVSNGISPRASRHGFHAISRDRLTAARWNRYWKRYRSSSPLCWARPG